MVRKSRSSSLSGEESAFRILSRREHSTSELRIKLRQRNFSIEEIEAVIAKCHRLGFLDDDRWAQAAVREALRKGKGPIHIRNFLEVNGIDPEGYVNVDQAAQIKRLMAGPLAKKDPQKVWTALLRRGFEVDAIREGLSNSEQKGYN